MKKYKAIYHATSTISVIILSSYVWWIYQHTPLTVTMWNTAIPLIGSLVLFAATLVASALAQEEMAQADSYVADSEYAEIDDNGEVVV
ncbi:MAG: hypothetical protein KAJ03_07280 [Gammaproteobacteria bacterium]|nr:hypothetical protein [Gammaproteobacteria bacterium]